MMHDAEAKTQNLHSKIKAAHFLRSCITGGKRGKRLPVVYEIEWAAALLFYPAIHVGKQTISAVIAAIFPSIAYLRVVVQYFPPPNFAHPNGGG